MQLSEVQAVFTTAGDPDALVWLQVPDVERLGQVIEQLRRRGRVTGHQDADRARYVVAPPGPRGERPPGPHLVLQAGGTDRGGAGRRRARVARGRLRQGAAATSGAADAPRAPTAHTDDADDGAGPAGTWSKAMPRRRRRRPLRRSRAPAPAPASWARPRADLPAVLRQGDRPRARRARRPSPQGVPYLSCAAPRLLRRRAQPEPGGALQRIGLAGPRRPSPPRRASPPSTAPGPRSASPIDGEGNSFAYDGRGWSGNLGAWGAANQISCVSPSFCVAAEGGPSVWNGQHLDPAERRRHPGPAQLGLLRHAPPSASWSTAAAPC